MKSNNTHLPLTVGIALLSGLASSASAADNPFLIKPLSNGYQLTENNIQMPSTSTMKLAPATSGALPMNAADAKKADGGCGAGSCAAKMNKLDKVGDVDPTGGGSCAAKLKKSTLKK